MSNRFRESFHLQANPKRHVFWFVQLVHCHVKSKRLSFVFWTDGSLNLYLKIIWCVVTELWNNHRYWRFFFAQLYTRILGFDYCWLFMVEPQASKDQNFKVKNTAIFATRVLSSQLRCRWRRWGGGEGGGNYKANRSQFISYCKVDLFLYPRMP